MVLINPELDKTLRSLLDGEVQMLLHVMMLYDRNFGLSMADTCCTHADV